MKKIFVLLSVFACSCSVSKVKNTSERYCIVVEEVRRNKKNSAIKPKCQNPKYKGKLPWYRYPTPNVFVGDTVDVCDLDIIQPRF